MRARTPNTPIDGSTVSHHAIITLAIELRQSTRSLALHRQALAPAATGAFIVTSGAYADCINLSITQLYAQGKAFNFIGTGAVTTFNVGTAGAPGLAVTSDTDTGLWAPASNTLAVSTGGSERLRIDSSGNVGIGTTSPGEPLVVARASTSSDVQAQFTDTSGTASSLFIGGKWPSGWPGLGTNNATNLSLVTNSAARVTIDSSGNVGIGTTSPIGVLNLKGTWGQNTAAPQIVVQNDSSSTGIAGIGFKAYGYGNSAIWMLYAYPSSDGRLCTGINGTNEPFCLLSNGGWTTPSDRNLKTDIRPITGTLEKLSSITGSYFRWRDPKMPGQQLGVIAQDVEKSFPELVHKGMKDFKTVNTMGLIAPLIQAVNELKSLFDGDHEKLIKLEAEFEAYKAAHP